MKKIIYVALLLFGSQAFAFTSHEVLDCAGEGIHLTAYQLEQTDFRGYKAAAILKEGIQARKLLTGTLTVLATRVGYSYSYQLADEAGNKHNLSVYSSFFPSQPPSRAPQPEFKLTGTMNNVAVQCIQ